jgi:hypothetical protein
MKTPIRLTASTLALVAATSAYAVDMGAYNRDYYEQPLYQNQIQRDIGRREVLRHDINSPRYKGREILRKEQRYRADGVVHSWERKDLQKSLDQRYQALHQKRYGQQPPAVSAPLTPAPAPMTPTPLEQQIEQTQSYQPYP